MDIQIDFGLRVKELRARSGMSQEVLAYRASIDRSYLGAVERGERNISLQNIEKIAAGLKVSIAYLFSVERFSTNLAYQQKEFKVPFLERFKYQFDKETKTLTFQIIGLLTGKDVEYMNSTLLGICSAYREGEINLFCDHREMKAIDGEAVVYSPEVAEQARIFQQNLVPYTKKLIVMCNSDYMIEQLNHQTKESGIHGKSTFLYGKDKEMVGRAYELLDIKGNELISISK